MSISKKDKAQADDLARSNNSSTDTDGAKAAKSVRKPFFRFIKGFVRIFRRRPEFTYLGEKPRGACIYLSNHSAASGPATYELYFPKAMRMWGAHEMCGGFRSRWRYLNRVYFGKKKKRSKFTSFILATLLTPLMALFYKGMRIIPTYPDLRLAATVRESVTELADGVSILIYPENSDDGYHEILTEYYGGFYMLAKHYCDVTGKDINIVNMYYHKKSNRVTVGAPISFSELSKVYDDPVAAAEYFKLDANKMFAERIAPFTKTKKRK